jgi:hypothetical protein
LLDILTRNKNEYKDFGNDKIINFGLNTINTIVTFSNKEALSDFVCKELLELFLFLLRYGYHQYKTNSSNNKINITFLGEVLEIIHKVVKRGSEMTGVCDRSLGYFFIFLIILNIFKDPFRNIFNNSGVETFLLEMISSSVNEINIDQKTVDIQTNYNFPLLFSRSIYLPYTSQNHKTHFSCSSSKNTSTTTTQKAPATPSFLFFNPEYFERIASILALLHKNDSYSSSFFNPLVQLVKLRFTGYSQYNVIAGSRLLYDSVLAFPGFFFYFNLFIFFF